MAIKRLVYSGLFGVLLMLACSMSIAQTVWADAVVSRKSVYPGEPFNLTVTVYTSTWFTTPVQFDNLQIPNAFVLKSRRTVPGMMDVNGKKYATIRFYYRVFPYTSGEYITTPIGASFESPKEGDYKGTKHRVETKPIHFQVVSPPDNWNDKEWFVAGNVFISEKWDRSLDQVMTGNVLERTITIKAKGTMPGFIPEPLWLDVDGARVYPKSIQLTDERTDDQANGRLVQKVVYLLEREGKVTIPEFRVDWFNPSARKAYFKTLPAIELNVIENPDLDILATARDSLLMADVNPDEGAIEEEFLLFGYKPWKVIATAIVVVWFLIRLVRLIRRALDKQRARHEAYLSSTKYYRDQLLKEHSGDRSALLNAFYGWWDRLRKPYSQADVRTAVDDADLKAAWNAFQDGGSLANSDRKKLVESLESEKTDDGQSWQLNP